MKIGSISPDILHTCAKVEPDNNIISKTAHFIAPEIRQFNNRNNEASTCGPEVDIYSFGIVALEMFNMELGGNGDTHTVTDELIEASIAALEDEKQKDFLKICLNNDPTKRQSSYDLLFHPLLFEIPTLKRLSAHYYYKYNGESHGIFFLII
jgi:nuclear receptor-binding protein